MAEVEERVEAPLTPDVGRLGTFEEVKFYVYNGRAYVKWVYDGDKGMIYNCKFRIYPHGYRDYTTRPRFFHKWSNPPRNGLIGWDLSDIVDEDTGETFPITPGESWVHIWWDSFNITYGRADQMLETGSAGDVAGDWLMSSFIGIPRLYWLIGAGIGLTGMGAWVYEQRKRREMEMMMLMMR